MALFGVGRRATHGREPVPGPDLVEPRRGLDGWTLEGTAFADRFDRDELRELGTLLHGVHAGMRTAWTYERAADLLERAGERPQALAVVDAWFALPDDVRSADSAATRSLGRHRRRLRGRLATAAATEVSVAPTAIPAQTRPGVRIPVEPVTPPVSSESTAKKTTRQ